MSDTGNLEDCSVFNETGMCQSEQNNVKKYHMTDLCEFTHVCVHLSSLFLFVLADSEDGSKSKNLFSL